MRQYGIRDWSALDKVVKGDGRKGFLLLGGHPLPKVVASAAAVTNAGYDRGHTMTLRSGRMM